MFKARKKLSSVQHIFNFQKVACTLDSFLLRYMPFFVLRCRTNSLADGLYLWTRQTHPSVTFRETVLLHVRQQVTYAVGDTTQYHLFNKLYKHKNVSYSCLNNTCKTLSNLRIISSISLSVSPSGNEILIVRNASSSETFNALST